MHFPALVFVHLFFFTKPPTFQIFCHYTAATPLHHILISHSYKLPVHCFLPTASSISSLSGEGGVGNLSSVKLRKLLMRAGGSSMADISLCCKLEKGGARVKAQIMGIISPAFGLQSRHLPCRSSYLDLLFIITGKKIQIVYSKSVSQTIVSKIFSTAY